MGLSGEAVNSSSLRLLALFFYALSLAPRESFYLWDGLPLVLALAGMRSGWWRLGVRWLKLNLFLALLALSLFLANEGMEKILVILFRSNLILLFTLALFGERDRFEAVRAMAELRFPAKLVSLTFFCVRFVESFIVEIAGWRERLRARGVRLGSNQATYKGFGYLLGSLLSKAFEESDNLVLTLRARGYQGEILLSSSSLASFLDKILLLSSMVIWMAGWTLLCWSL